MDKPNELTCIFRARGVEAYRIDGRIRIFREQITSTADKKTGVRTEQKSQEQAWLDDWQPTTATLKKAKVEIVEFAKSWNYLSPVHAK